MESIKLVYELSILSNRINSNFLTHLFKNFDPQKSKAYHATLKNFQIPHLEASDYRSAYHQLCDWLYGWNVADVSQIADDPPDVKGNLLNFMLTGRRKPREIDIANDVELRILATFQTLFYFSQRQLNKQYGSIEGNMLKLGQGLQVATANKGAKSKQEGDIEESDQEMDRVWAKTKKNHLEEEGDMFKSSDSLNNAVEILLKTNEKGYTVKAAEIEEETITEIIALQPAAAPAIEFPLIDIAEEDPNAEKIISEDQPPKSATEETDQILNSTLDIASNNNSSQSATKELNVFEIAQQLDSITAPKILVPLLQQDPYLFMKSSLSNSDLQPKRTAEAKLNLQNDITSMLIDIDRSCDYTLLCLVNIITILAFAELLEHKEVYQKQSAQGHQLAADFISNTVKTVWDLLNKEFPGEVLFYEVRDLGCLGARIKQIIKTRLDTYEVRGGMKVKHRFVKLHKKFEFLHILFSGIDIHVFPRFLHAHQEGCKSMSFSEFDSALWLSGGYDGLIKIHDLRPGIPTGAKVVPLAQFVGHKSIVTDVHFTKKDALIVSSSFDRTIKIWNSQNGTCQKTLQGHTDSVTTCDVSKDGRFIASGSIDCTVRFWDLASGECTSVIKKHSRWVKIVRFSPDGKYLASAGLDKRIYIWDTRIILNSKTITHTRCIEFHTDTVLDMVLTKQGIIITTSRDSKVRVYDYINGHQWHVIDLSPSWACSVTVSECGEYFATGSFDNSVNIFKTRSGNQVRHLRVFNLGVLCVRFPIDLEYLVVGSNEGFIQQLHF